MKKIVESSPEPVKEENKPSIETDKDKPGTSSSDPSVSMKVEKGGGEKKDNTTLIVVIIVIVVVIGVLIYLNMQKNKANGIGTNNGNASA
jgi:uncharacterized protein HemX